MKRYLAVWLMTAKNTLQISFVNRWSNLLFFIGKILRFGMMLLFLAIVKNNAQSFLTYSTNQIVIFFLTYHVVDLVSQILFRGVYHFSNQVRTGEFDAFLSKPINPLFRIMTGFPDFADAIFLIPSLAVFAYILQTLDLTFTSTAIIWYGLLFLNAMVISTAIHIVILGLGILTTEIDGLVWLFRDLNRLGQFPVDMYLWPVRLALLFLIPVGVMVSIPSQVLINKPTILPIATAFAIGLTSLFLSLRFWNWAVKQYSSASS